MTHVKLLLLLISSAIICGCATAPERTARHAMIDAQASISAGHTLAGLEYLAEAYQLPDPNGIAASFGILLEAELRLRERNLEQASALANQVLRAEPTNPHAREVAGKAILLAGGPFEVAEEHFLVAGDNYAKAGDLERIGDLLALARGFSAYSAGDLKVAEKYWRDIGSDELRYHLDRATRDVLRGSSTTH